MVCPSQFAGTCYSAIEHLAKCLGGPHWKKTGFGMFSAYFDASGDIHSAAALAIAGFVGPADSWIDWENKWLERLRGEGLEYFHRNELSGWPERKLRLFLEDLAEIIVAHGFYRFGVAIINRDLKSVRSEEDRERWHINAYSYAGRALVTEVRHSRLLKGLKNFPRLVFEDGDSGRGRLDTLLQRDGFPRPIFEPKRDRRHRKTGILQKAVVPLQAADLYAYDLFSRARDITEGRKVSINFANGINPIIERLPGRSGVATPAHIEFMAEGMEQKDRLIMVPKLKINTKDFIS